MKVYISGPLQGSSDLEAARVFYDKLAALVVASGHEAYVPHHSTDPRADSCLSASAVFSTDVAALNRADAVLAHIGLPSTGVGAELALAVASGRQVLGLKRPGERGSRFAEGLIADAGGHVHTFANDAELRAHVKGWLSRPPRWFGNPRSIQLRQSVVA